MFASLRKLLFKRIDLELVSRYPLAESVRTLSEATYSQFFPPPGLTEIAIGRVDERTVLLARRHPFLVNSFKPYFDGAFHREGSRVTLRGSYRMHHGVHFFLSLWAIFLAASAIELVNDAGTSALRNLSLKVYILASVPLLMLLVGKLPWRSDIKWMNGHLRQLLQ
jgi:hypothetical protein